MKLPTILPTLALAALSGHGRAATIVDNFDSGVLGTTVVILDNDHDSVYNTTSWDTTGGTAKLVTSVYDNIQQSATTYSGYSLAIDEELQLDVASGTAGGSQDIGLYVGGVQPTVDLRGTYVNIYVRSNGQLYSRGFNSTTELALVGGATPTFNKLFIKRTAANSYELGTYNGLTRTVLTTRTGLTNNDADAIGLYTDVRAAGTLRAVDNLVIVPEPSAALLGGLGMIGLLRRRRA